MQAYKWTRSQDLRWSTRGGARRATMETYFGVLLGRRFRVEQRRNALSRLERSMFPLPREDSQGSGDEVNDEQVTRKAGESTDAFDTAFSRLKTATGEMFCTSNSSKIRKDKNIYCARPPTHKQLYEHTHTPCHTHLRKVMKCRKLHFTVP